MTTNYRRRPPLPPPPPLQPTQNLSSTPSNVRFCYTLNPIYNTPLDTVVAVSPNSLHSLTLFCIILLSPYRHYGFRLRTGRFTWQAISTKPPLQVHRKSVRRDDCARWCGMIYCTCVCVCVGGGGGGAGERLSRGTNYFARIWRRSVWRALRWLRHRSVPVPKKLSDIPLLPFIHRTIDVRVDESAVWQCGLDFFFFFYSTAGGGEGRMAWAVFRCWISKYFSQKFETIKITVWKSDNLNIY